MNSPSLVVVTVTLVDGDPMPEMFVVMGTLSEAIQASPAPSPTNVGMAGIRNAAAGLILAGGLLPTKSCLSVLFLP